MNAVDTGERYARDAAALQAAKGIAANKSFLLLFFICFLVAGVGLLTIGVSGLWGWIMVAVLGLLGGLGAWSGKGDEMMTIGVAVIGGICGIVALIATAFVLLGIR